PPLQRRALVDLDLADDQRLAVEALAGLGVGDRALQQLAYVLGRGLRRELQHRQRLVHGQPAYEIDHATRLHQRDADEERYREDADLVAQEAVSPGAHTPELHRAHRLRAFRTSFSWPRNVRVGANPPRL